MQPHPYIKNLSPSYLFAEIQKRKDAFSRLYPKKRVISLGIGDACLPIPGIIGEAMAKKALLLSSQDGFTGYGPSQGSFALRERISEVYYQGRIDPEEIFITDGAKSDIGRIQAFFGSRVKIALPNPSYPVYYDGSILFGTDKVHFLPCTKENNFFPDDFPSCDLLYLCSPNNPTGTAATKDRLQDLVDKAVKKKTLILFDAAYSAYIRSPDALRSIYEIEEANEIAIEIGSFSKSVGFTGVRLGYTVVPKKLGALHADWKRYFSTIFNGACNIAEAGGLAALSEEGQKAALELTDHYLDCAKTIKTALMSKGYKVYGGKDAPYLFVECNKPSFEAFDDFLHRYGLLTVPGIGFGEFGEGYLRLSSFLTKENAKEAADRLLSETAYASANSCLARSGN